MIKLNYFKLKQTNWLILNKNAKKIIKIAYNNR